MISKKTAAVFAIFCAVALAGATQFSRADEDCGAQIKELHHSADQLKDAKQKGKVEKLLAKANDELTTEHDAKECLEYTAKAKKTMGLK